MQSEQQHSEKIDLLIQAYLNGTITEADGSILLNWVKADSDNKKYFQDHCQIWNNTTKRKISHSFNSEKAFAKFKLFTGNESISVHRNTRSFNKKLFYRLSIAACILLLIGLSINYFNSNKNPQEKSLYSKYYAPYRKDDKLLVNRSGITKAEQKYVEGDYLGAFSILQNTPDTKDIQAEKKFYMGLSLMGLKRFDEAIDNFSVLLNESNQSKYFSEAHWYLGLCYLNTDQKSKAVETFRNVVRYKGFKYKEAGKILLSLEN